ncbi:MAG: M14 family zinc carboxypeptidase [Pseudoxanthomonas sp.]
MPTPRAAAPRRGNFRVAISPGSRRDGLMNNPFPPFLSLTLMAVSPVAADTANAACPAPTVSASTAIPPPPAWLDGLARDYDLQLRTPGLEQRTFQPELWWQVVTPLLTRARGFHVEEIGRSAEGRPLRHVRWGEGQTSVLLWSQMHGDESTASMALADLFRFLGEHPDDPRVTRLRRQVTLHFMPIVNPDGAARFQRNNAQGIDLNRDARALSSPEARALKALHDRVHPAFGFNLHDQRVGYRVGATDRGAAITLLAPPFDAARSVDAVRARAIEVAAVIRLALEPSIAGHIGRWDDSFNPLAFGDLMTQWGTSVILIESGGIEGDPEKQQLRKLNFLALVAGLDAIATGRHAGISHAFYDELPQNGRVISDLLIRDGILALPGTTPVRADLRVDFKHPLAWRDGRIVEIGDLAQAEARRVVDARGLYITPLDGEDSALPIQERSARLRFSRDPEGKDVVWVLDRDLPEEIPGSR